MMVNFTFDPKTGQATIDKPLSAVNLDALSVQSCITTVTGDKRTVKASFLPKGTAEVNIENGKFSFSASECSVQYQDAQDGNSYIATISAQS